MSATAWLAQRRSAPPASLAEAVARYAAGREAGDVPEQLAAAAMDALETALERPEDRAGAWDLLAADALLTYAFEAAAEEGAAAVERLAAALGPDRFDRLLDDHSRGRT